MSKITIGKALLHEMENIHYMVRNEITSTILDIKGKYPSFETFGEENVSLRISAFEAYTTDDNPNNEKKWYDGFHIEMEVMEENGNIHKMEYSAYNWLIEFDCKLDGIYVSDEINIFYE